MAESDPSNPDDLPCCDPVSAEVINRWFDYFVLKERDDKSSRAGARREVVERIRLCAIEGSRKAEITGKKMQLGVAKALRQIAEEIEKGARDADV